MPAAMKIANRTPEYSHILAAVSHKHVEDQGIRPVGTYLPARNAPSQIAPTKPKIKMGVQIYLMAIPCR